MQVSARYTLVISATIAITTLVVFNNCGQVKFNSASTANEQSPAAQGNPSTPPTTPVTPPTTPTPPTSTQLQLSTINAVAWEDLYYPPGTTPSVYPDYDYNDFLTEFEIQEKTETIGTQQYITDIYIDFYPRAVGAGDDHQLLLSLTGQVTTAAANSSLLPTTAPMFSGSAQVTLTYYDANGNVTGQPTSFPYNQDIVVYQSTHEAFGVQSGLIDTRLPSGYTSGVPSNYIYAQQNARIHITLEDPEMNPVPTNGLFDSSKFRVVLHNLATNYNEDIINVDPQNFDMNGYPWGFIIPTDWQWMQEGVKIDNGYPLLSQYRQYLLGQNPNPAANVLNWFNYPAQDPNNKILYPKIPFQPFLPPVQ